MSGTALYLRACAKINWVLEVLGRRPDGYHEIRTVLQTVALCDRVSVRLASEPSLTVAAPPGWDLGPQRANLASRAAVAYPAAPVLALRLRKRVPPAAGLGGGSSNAAAVLRGCEQHSTRPLGFAALERIAARLGSDVPFFVRGGTQLAAGRGERLGPLPDVPPAWLVLVTPALATRGKTARLFGSLDAGDYSDGAATERFVQRLTTGMPLTPDALHNVFDQVADAAFPELPRYRAALRQACGQALLCGAGPALFALLPGEHDARKAARRLRALRMPALAVRTVSAAESTRSRWHRVNA